MSLMKDIEDHISTTRKKWQILYEYKTEIDLMISESISLKKQIELILKNGILEKLDYNEYRKILIRHFGYESAKQKTKKTQANPVEPKKHPIQKPKKRASELLSQDIDLMEYSL